MKTTEQQHNDCKRELMEKCFAGYAENGLTDTGVKAAGQDGAAGNDGAPGKDGSSPGWFFGEGYTQSVFLQDGAVIPKFREKLSSGGLVSCDGENLKLKKGHNYLVSVTGSVYAQTNDKSGNYSVQMTDGQNDALCRETTRTVVKKSTSGRAQQSIGLPEYTVQKTSLRGNLRWNKPTIIPICFRSGVRSP